MNGNIEISGPTIFLERETLVKFGGYEEKYPFIEDYPLGMRYVLNGYKLGLVNKTLIRYRVYPESVSRANPKFAESIYRAYEDYGIPAAWRNKQYLHWYHGVVRKAIRDKSLPKLLLYILSGIDILNWKEKLKKKK